MTLSRIVLAATMACIAPQHATAQETRQTYIVQLADPPLASYTGGLKGFAPTIVHGQRLDTDSEAARRYTTYLEEKQRAVLALVAEAPVQYRYTVTLNGFAAMLTPDEVARLKAHPDVTQVSLSTEEHTTSGGSRTLAIPPNQR